MVPIKSKFNRNKAEEKCSIKLSAMEVINQPLEPQITMARIRIKARIRKMVRMVSEGH